jgi:tetratricopeptide (TPR) repeat protein
MAQPQTTSNDIIERLNALSEMDSAPTEFQIASLRRDIEALKRVDMATGLMVQGVFHACLGSPEDSMDCHRRSIAASGGQARFYENFAVSLKRLGRFIDACDNYLAALRKDPANRLLLLKLANTTFYTGRVSCFQEAVERYIAATGDDSITQRHLIAINFTLMDQMAALDLREADFVSAFAKVEDVVRSHSKELIGASGSLISDHESSYLFCQLKVDASPSELVQMSDELACLVAEDIEFSVWNKIVHAFVPVGDAKLMKLHEELEA